MTLDYDESARIEALRQLPPRLRVAWALLCVERALPGLRRFHARTGVGNPFVAESLLERLWLDVAGDPMTPSELEAAHRSSEEMLIDVAEGSWHVPSHANAHDAMAALTFAFDTRLSGAPQEAAWAGRRLYDLADEYAQRDLAGRVSRAHWTAVDEKLVLEHPLVQGELARQERDLRELGELGEPGPDFRDSLERLKARSASEAADFLS